MPGAAAEDLGRGGEAELGGRGVLRLPRISARDNERKRACSDNKYGDDGRDNEGLWTFGREPWAVPPHRRGGSVHGGPLGQFRHLPSDVDCPTLTPADTVIDRPDGKLKTPSTAISRSRAAVLPYRLAARTPMKLFRFSASEGLSAIRPLALEPALGEVFRLKPASGIGD